MAKRKKPSLKPKPDMSGAVWAPSDVMADLHALAKKKSTAVAAKNTAMAVTAPRPGRTPFSTIAGDIAALLEQKNAAYGNSFEEAEKILQVLFPNGVPVSQYKDLLTVVRIVDKLFRIANDKTAFAEDPWRDIAGYAILSLWSASRDE